MIVKKIVIGLSAALAVSAWAAEIPDRPEKLKFPKLQYEPPVGADYRVQLKSGPVVYLVPSTELPLVNLSIRVRTGKYVVPAGKEGLAAAAGGLLASAGTKDRTAEELQERLAFLAARLSSSVGETSGGVNLNLLSKDLDEGMKILREVLTEPRFQQDRLDLLKKQSLSAMKQRNDDSRGLEGRNRLRLGYGENFFRNRLPTKASIESLTRADLRQFHRDWFHPANFVVAVSGDFKRAEMIARLEKLFAKWPFKGKKAPAIPTNKTIAKPGIYFLDKQVNQGRVSVILPGVTRDNPDYFAITVMNDILGGGGFTSRITNRVRSDEGLAYSAYSIFPGGTYFTRTFVAAFQSKSSTVLFATQIVLEEMQKIASEEVTDSELETAKNSFIQTFPQRFATKGQVAGAMAGEEFTGRAKKDPDHFKNYRRRIAAVTKADVRRVAKKYLNPDQAVILIVGDKKEILKGHPDHRVELKSLSTGGVTDLPLRDPFTLEPLK
jgi:predicted Zn-dependent peptidase